MIALDRTIVIALPARLGCARRTVFARAPFITGRTVCTRWTLATDRAIRARLWALGLSRTIGLRPFAATLGPALTWWTWDSGLFVEVRHRPDLHVRLIRMSRHWSIAPRFARTTLRPPVGPANTCRGFRRAFDGRASGRQLRGHDRGWLGRQFIAARWALAPGRTTVTAPLFATSHVTAWPVPA